MNEMKVLFSELDGTTWAQELPMDYLAPEIRFPLYPAVQVWAAEYPTDVALTLQNPTFKTRRYQRIGVSGELVFYDRIVDAEEIR